jgi:hypothetical protein
MGTEFVLEKSTLVKNFNITVLKLQLFFKILYTHYEVEHTTDILTSNNLFWPIMVVAFLRRGSAAANLLGLRV